MADKNRNRWNITGAVMVIAVIGGGFAWQYFQEPGLPEDFASGNGRIEATEFDIATKQAGRLEDVLVQEGDMIEIGQTVAVMDTAELAAQLREAKADLKRVQENKNYAIAVVAQRESELDFANKELTRSRALVMKGHVSKEKLDQDQTSENTAEAALLAARTQVIAADASIEAAVARKERIQIQIDDSLLKAFRGGRVLYRLAEPGEVLAAGGKILTVIELTDIYMTIFLPTEKAGRVSVGAEARIIFDARPDLVVPARVSFVAAEAQFTPKQVETRSEREKLMFRIKVKIDPKLLKKHIEKVKTGVRGDAYVRLDQTAEWPQYLQIKLPE